MKKIAVAFVAIVLAAFLLILTFTGLLGTYFGKKAEIVSLIVIAVILLILLLLNNRSDRGNENDKDENIE